MYGHMLFMIDIVVLLNNHNSDAVHAVSPMAVQCITWFIYQTTCGLFSYIHTHIHTLPFRNILNTYHIPTYTQSCVRTDTHTNIN